MERPEKLLERFLSKPTDFKYDQLRRLLRGFGYQELKTGRTSGSRITFANRQTKDIGSTGPTPGPFSGGIDLIEAALRGKGYIK